MQRQLAAEEIPEPAPVTVAAKPGPPPVPARSAAGPTPLKITIPNIKAARQQAAKPVELQSSFYSAGSVSSARPAAPSLPEPRRKAFAMNVGKMSPAIAASLSTRPAPPPRTLEQIISRDDEPSMPPPKPKPVSTRIAAAPAALASLSPAAGNEDQEPLIAVPQAPLPPAPPVAAAPKALPPVPTAASPARIPAPPAASAAPLLDIPPAPPVKATEEIIAQPVSQPAPAKPAARAGYNEAALDAMVEQILGPDEAKKSMSVPPDVVTAAATAKAVGLKNDADKMSVMPSSSEPQRSLSPASRKIAAKLPSQLDKKKKPGSEHIEIDRTKDYPVSVNNEEVTVKDEIPGMTLEIKNSARRVNLDYELEKAYNALLSGETMVAIEIYKRVLSADPGSRNALFGLATTYHRAGQVDLARPLYAKLLALDPKNRDALNNFLVLMADEAPEQALTQLRELELRNPDFSPIPAQMAVIYQKLGDPGKASEKMFRAIALAPENLIYRYNLAIMLDKQNKHEEAAQLYKQLVSAASRGENIPVNIQKIQERLTFISSNRN